VSLTARQYENVAWALDSLTRLTRTLLEPVAAMDELVVDSLEVTVELTRDGGPITPEDARVLLGWLDGDEMQNDLRAEPISQRALIEDALDDVQHWGSYADEYFQEKWKLKDDVEKWRDRLTALDADDADGGEEE
jgi:hypothetical protein